MDNYILGRVVIRKQTFNVVKAHAVSQGSCPSGILRDVISL